VKNSENDILSHARPPPPPEEEKEEEEAELDKFCMLGRLGAAFTKYFYNSSTIILQFFYDFSPRAFPSFSARNPSQPQKEKSFIKFGMHQILLQFFHKIAVETLFPY
jgi:hypothetical protein